MITLTPAEVRLRDFLAEIAFGANASRDPAESTLTYGQIATRVDPDNELGWKQGHPRYSRLITALFHVNTYEVERGRPMLGAFAMSSDTSIAGFANLARRDLGRKGENHEIWRTELEASAKYWGEHWTKETGVSDAPMTDAQFGLIMRELGAIKQMVRKLLHA